MAGRLKDIIIHLDYEDEYKDGKVEVNIIASEPEELIRCKNCKHWDTDWTPTGAENMDAHFCGMIGRTPLADYYCAFGEKEEE